MNKKAVGIALAVLFAGVAVSLAADGNMGIWKLNEAKSKIPAGATRNHTVTYTAAGDSIKVTVDGTGADGKPTHNEWTGKFDGKDYAVTGDPTSDSRSYKKVDASTTEITLKKAGKVTATGKIVLAADGKSRTVTVEGMDASGKKIISKAVYDKQ